jgi:hypothetical protein
LRICVRAAPKVQRSAPPPAPAAAPAAAPAPAKSSWFGTPKNDEPARSAAPPPPPAPVPVPAPVPQDEGIFGLKMPALGTVICMYVCMYVCMCVRVCVCIYTHIYTYIYMYICTCYYPLRVCVRVCCMCVGVGGWVFVSRSLSGVSLLALSLLRARARRRADTDFPGLIFCFLGDSCFGS